MLAIILTPRGTAPQGSPASTGFRTRVAGAALALTVVLLAAGCSGGDSSPPSTSAPATSGTPDASPTGAVSPTSTDTSPAPTNASGDELTGGWDGTFESITTAATGTFHVEFLQSGDQFTGTIEFPAGGCITEGTVSGTITNGVIAFAAIDAEQTVSFGGSLVDGQLSGSYSTQGCGNEAGNWEAQRAD